MNKLKRYIIFLIGLFVNSLGVSLITKANLGTSPISSIPYVLSLNFPLTLGNFTIIFSLLLIFLQLLILRKNFKPEYYLQIPVSILFGYFIDFTMILLAFVQPESYPSKIIYLLIGCVILGFGVYIEVLADVVMLPGESFVRAIVQTWNREFGSTKVHGCNCRCAFICTGSSSGWRPRRYCYRCTFSRFYCQTVRQSSDFRQTASVPGRLCQIR